MAKNAMSKKQKREEFFFLFSKFKYFYENFLSISVRELYDFLPTQVVKFSKKLFFTKSFIKKNREVITW